MPTHPHYDAALPSISGECRCCDQQPVQVRSLSTVLLSIPAARPAQIHGIAPTTVFLPPSTISVIHDPDLCPFCPYLFSVLSQHCPSYPPFPEPHTVTAPQIMYLKRVQAVSAAPGRRLRSHRRPALHWRKSLRASTKWRSEKHGLIPPPLSLSLNRHMKLRKYAPPRPCGRVGQPSAF